MRRRNPGMTRTSTVPTTATTASAAEVQRMTLNPVSRQVKSGDPSRAGDSGADPATSTGSAPDIPGSAR